MITRFKLVAAALGLVVATGAFADASAKTITKTVVTRHVVAHKIALRAQPRLHVGTRIVNRVRIVHLAPLGAKLVGTNSYRAHRVVGYPLYRSHGFYRTHVATRVVKHVRIVKNMTTKKIVRTGKLSQHATLSQHAMNHRGAKTVIR